MANATPAQSTGPCGLPLACAAGGFNTSASSLFGPTIQPVGLAALGPIDPVALANPFIDIAGTIPVLNIFIGNGQDGTAAHPDGFDGGLLIGSGGAGLTPTAAGATGGNGGRAGFFLGDGGAGGTGAAGTATSAGGGGAAGSSTTGGANGNAGSDGGTA